MPILKELFGLFVDDGFLALAVLIAIVVIGGASLLGWLTGAVTGLLLVIAVPGILIISVVRGVRL